MSQFKLLLLSFLLLCSPGVCQESQVRLQVLGSGGPELDDGRASSGYLVWVDDEARVLVDAGTGTALHFERSGAKLAELEVVLLSHLHVDHCGDLAALGKGLFFSERDRVLPVLGPQAGLWFPSTEEFVSRLFSEAESLYPYLSDFLDPENNGLQARAVGDEWSEEFGQGIRVRSRTVSHGNVPALAWRVEVNGRSLVFSGDFSGNSEHLASLAKDCDILVCHNSVPESATGLARRLHAPPSVIGQLAQASRARKLILSHRMHRSPSPKETLRLIRKHYDGPVEFAEDLSVFEAPIRP